MDFSYIWLSGWSLWQYCGAESYGGRKPTTGKSAAVSFSPAINAIMLFWPRKTLISPAVRAAIQCVSSAKDADYDLKARWFNQSLAAKNISKNASLILKIVCICRFTVIYLYEYTDCSIDFYAQSMRQEGWLSVIFDLQGDALKGQAWRLSRLISWLFIKSKKV